MKQLLELRLKALVNYKGMQGATANLAATKETSIVAAVASVFVTNDRKKGSSEGVYFSEN